MTATAISGLLFVVLFFGLTILLLVTGRKRPGRRLRDIPAFARLRRAVGLAVEAGSRLHVSLGRGRLTGLEGGSALLGLAMLERITRAASISDRPPLATSGEGVIAILSQDSQRSAYTAMSAEGQYDPGAGQVAGLTPFSYAAGTLPVIYDEQASANLLAGHFGSEVALITDAAERKDSLTVAGSDDLPAQAVLYAAAQEPLIGEELYVGGAYLGAGPMHTASLRAQDVFRWLLAAGISILAIAKLFGFL